MSEFVLITGLSGAGRSQAANVFEDLGWFVIDNLPPALIEKVAELAQQPGSTIEKVALAVGARDVEVDQLGRRIEQLAEVIEERMAADPPSTKQEGEVAQQVIGRLRNLGTGARQLGNGILDDVRSRRKR